MKITQERLKELLSYDPLTGVFLWLVDRGGKKAGDVAGCRKRKYTVISVDDQIYRAHHLAWLYMTGEWPSSFLDHRDLDKHNNIWTNLRLATKSQNQANVGLIASNKSGLKGVSRYRAGEAYGKPWQASIGVNGKSKHLGHFPTKEEAHAAYVTAAENIFGEFARAA
ncbi:MAG TPA: HNH endonuclease [Steroidobacteraceae bacterium]|nr:HNH endonuclease [Steroidobacteraceae bacterium]